MEHETNDPWYKPAEHEMGSEDPHVTITLHFPTNYSNGIHFQWPQPNILENISFRVHFFVVFVFYCFVLFEQCNFLGLSTKSRVGRLHTLQKL